MEGIIISAMVLAIPIVAILTGAYTSKLKHERQIVHDQITLEQLKHDNYIAETEKMRLELEQQKLLLQSNRQVRLDTNTTPRYLAETESN